jgi:hypothetical protein
MKQRIIGHRDNSGIGMPDVFPLQKEVHNDDRREPEQK